VSRPALGHT